jgi:hypothetical protein
MSQRESTPDSATETETVSRGFAARFGGALRLDASVFEEVEHDPGAMPQAVIVVAIAAFARALQILPEQGWIGAAVSVFAAFVVWFAVTAAVTTVGVRIFHGSSSFDELLRTVGFAAAPLVILAVCALPLGGVGTAISFGVHAVAIEALVVAVRQALDIDTARAIAVCAGAVGLGLGVLLLLGVILLGRSLA